METMLINRLSALSHPQRMAVFKLLMRRCPDALAAGEICQTLGLKPSTASVYLSALTQVGLITQRRDKTRLLYAVDLVTARAVVAGLFMDCCGGRADLCEPHFTAQNQPPITGRTRHVLFLCSGNSARSIMAETILRDIAGADFTAHSAGRVHRSDLNVNAVQTLQARGHDVAPLRFKNMDEFQSDTSQQMDFVFTVCDLAANEDIPNWPGNPIGSHWGVPDPVAMHGGKAETKITFDETYAALHQRITAFAALPFDQLTRGSLQQHVDEIGTQTIQKELVQS